MKKLGTLFALCALTLTAAPALARGSGVIKFDEATIEVADDHGGGDDGGGGDHGGGGGDDHGGGAAGTIRFDQSDFQALENAGHAVVTVEREHGGHGAVTVQYATADGTATAGQDYTATSGTLSWADGDESRKVIMIPVANDNVTEGSETIRLTLSAPTGGAVLDGQRASAVLTLLEGGRSGDDDGGHHGSNPGTLRFDERSFQAVEGAGVARIVVERSGGDHGAVSVHFQTADGSALAGQDYTATSGTLSWNDGDEAPKVVEVPILDDTLAEGNETVLLTLSDATGGATVDPTRGTATLDILDDEGGTAACEPGDDTLCLAGGRFKVQIVWRTGQGATGVGHGAPLSAVSGTFWFFDPANAEMLIKVLDACQGFHSFWVFFAATTDVDFTATVTDTHTGIVKQYSNPSGRAAQPVEDTSTFATCGR
jgi:hypothetical protein